MRIFFGGGGNFSCQVISVKLSVQNVTKLGPDVGVCVCDGEQVMLGGSGI